VRLLPSVTEAGTRAGVTARCWHGIPAGTPVTAAMGDLQCYMLATRLSDTDAGLSLESVWVFMITVHKSL